MRWALLLTICLPAMALAWNDQDEDRFQALVAELRCLVCQNQSIADSAAPLAQDLRAQVREMMDAGRSDDEIRTFMTARYGDFVLYRPPVKARTWALWFGPFVMLLAGAAIIWRIRTPRTADEAPPPADPEAVRALLEEADGDAGERRS